MKDGDFKKGKQIINPLYLKKKELDKFIREIQKKRDVIKDGVYNR